MRTLISIFLIIYLNTIFIFPATALEEYRFERYWPVLQQPWYFSDATDLAIDSKNNVYVIDGSSNDIRKFTFNGLFIKNLPAYRKGFSSDAIAIDNEDNVYVLSRRWGDSTDSTSKFISFILKFDSKGNKDSNWKELKINSFLTSIAVDRLCVCNL